MSRILALAVVVGTSLHALAQSPPVARAIEDLRTCTKIDSALCRTLPGRLAAHGATSVMPIHDALPTLPPQARTLAAIALTQIDHLQSTKLLVELARKDDLLLLTVVIPALGERQGKEVDRALVGLLRSPHPHLRGLAAEALGKAKSKRDLTLAVPALLRAFRDPIEAVKVAAIESVGLIGDRRVVPELLAHLNDSRPRVRRTVLFALRFVSDLSAVPKLLDLLTDDDLTFVREVASTLEKLTGQRFGLDVELWRGWWRRQIDL